MLRISTYYFAVIILHNIWMLQLTEKFDFLKPIIKSNRGMRQEIQINNYKDNLQRERTMRIITTIYQNNNNNNNCRRVSHLGPQLASIVRFGSCLTDLFNPKSRRDASHMCLISLSPRHMCSSGTHVSWA